MLMTDEMAHPLSGGVQGLHCSPARNPALAAPLKRKGSPYTQLKSSATTISLYLRWGKGSISVFREELCIYNTSHDLYIQAVPQAARSFVPSHKPISAAGKILFREIPFVASVCVVLAGP